MHNGHKRRREPSYGYPRLSVHSEPPSSIRRMPTPIEVQGIYISLYWKIGHHRRIYTLKPTIIAVVLILNKNLDALFGQPQ